MKGSSSERIGLKVDNYVIGPENRLFAGASVHLSALEILQAGAVKGLNKLNYKEKLQYGITVIVRFVLAVTLCGSRN